MGAWEFPGGARFAFTVIDDTDVATVANVAPIYALLEKLGMRTTKTVWPVACAEGSRDFSSSETLADAAYRAWVLGLRDRGFEITWHGATMESSPRDRTVAALERYRQLFGRAPHIHVNHASNRENVYWGSERVDNRLLKGLVERLSGHPAGFFQGQTDGSPYFWGDLCRAHMTYARNLTFNDINLASINPSMPYHDPVRPLVPWWFSSSDADDVSAFNALLAPRHLDRLERDGGFSIVATHFGKRFVTDGAVDPVTVERLTDLAGRRGWFPTAGELLDWLRTRRADAALPAREWRRMQWQWARDLGSRRWEHSRRRRAARREAAHGR